MNIHSDSEEIKRQIFQNFQNIQTRLEPVEERERERGAKIIKIFLISHFDQF